MSLSKNVLPPSSTLNLMDMPILVMRKIVEDVDFATMLNLRKVCEDFQYYIDENFMDFRSAHLDIRIEYDRVLLRLYDFESKCFGNHNSVEIRFPKIDNGGCRVMIENRIDDLYHILESNFLDEFGTCLEGILKNLKNPLKLVGFATIAYLGAFEVQKTVEVQSPREVKKRSIFQSILGCCISRKMKTRNSEKLDVKSTTAKKISIVWDSKGMALLEKLVFEKVEKILKSTNPRIQIQKLTIYGLEPTNFSKIASNIDKLKLEQLELSCLPSNENRTRIVELDEILNFRSFPNLYRLRTQCIRLSPSTLESISHVRQRDLLQN